MAKEKKLSSSELKGFCNEQRQRLKVSQDTLLKRVNKAPFGNKAKELAKKWAENESLGSVGWGLFNVTPIIEKAEGSYLYDVDGKKYLDLLSGFSVSQFGNCQSELTKIIQDQANKLTHYFDFPHPERIKLAEKLNQNSKLSGSTKVAFGGNRFRFN